MSPLVIPSSSQPQAQALWAPPAPWWWPSCPLTASVGPGPTIRTPGSKAVIGTSHKNPPPFLHWVLSLQFLSPPLSLFGVSLGVADVLNVW